ncbi:MULTISPECIES: MauE/DoxX family redox-associated membrane protein [Altibacter]|uniref:DoxX family protein n=1 Tax=Altibacter TaxID=1535231 RepID=UPI00055030D1|nr:MULTISPECIES: MauE/DoxX family redox-associated membrane protein [Altibacter]MCW8982387.1 hypothetical protein [Altibacter sp.]MCW9036338.1 hypothetical protein [Altibacter sp.]
MLPWHQYLLGFLLLIAGFNHFRSPKIYERIMPPYLPATSTMVLVSGIAEMVLGLMLLNPDTQIYAAWGIIVMLLLFLSVHIHMLQNEKAALKLPKWVLWLRIPLQFVLMYWAYQYV